MVNAMLKMIFQRYNAVYLPLIFMRSSLRHTFQALLLLLTMLPAISGIHVFHQFCHSCVEDVTSASVFSTFHEHHHDCNANICESSHEQAQECPCSCSDQCDSSSTCQHEYKVMEFASVQYPSVRIVITQTELPPYIQHDTCLACLETNSVQLTHLSFYTTSNLPEPDRWKKNGVFLL
jgi:hypothetical protein